MSNKKNTHQNKSGKDNADKNDSKQKSSNKFTMHLKGVRSKTINKENFRKKSSSDKSAEKRRSRQITDKVVSRDHLKPNSNRTNDPTPKKPVPKKRCVCVVCGSPHIENERTDHMKDRSHRHKIDFLQDFKNALKPGMEKPEEHYTELTGEVLKSSGNNGWYCHACGGQVPPGEKPQDHLISPKHERAVYDLWKALKARRVFVNKLRKDQIPKDVEHTFYQEGARAFDDE